MRVVLGYSATPESDAAAALVAGVAWPDNSEFYFVHAVATRAADAPDSAIPNVPQRVPTRLGQDDAEQAAAAAGKWLDAIPGAQFKLGYGGASTVLSEEAQRMDADLLVVGSRRRGAMATFVLGSVSADLVDRATCPVLIVRKPSLQNVVVATDGSATAVRALEIVGAWPMFERARISVVSVGDSAQGGEFDQQWTEPTGAAVKRSRAHVAVAAAAARELRSAGRHARATSRVGNTSAQILDVATQRKADLIVLGSRGHTGIARALLGSTAREVLLATDASVMICPTRTPG